MAIDITTYALIVGIFMIAFVLGWFYSGRSVLYLHTSFIILAAMIFVFGALLVFESFPQLALTGFVGGAICMIIIGYRIRIVYSIPSEKLRFQLDKMLKNMDFTAISDLSYTTSYDHMNKLFRSLQETMMSLVNIVDELVSFETQTKLVSESLTQLSHKIDQDNLKIINDIDESLQSAVVGNEISERLQRSIQQLEQDFNQYNHQLSKTIHSADLLSDNTNLIAVNAAIEAANTSEESENFAIVAEGIQQLSSRSKSTTLELEKLNDELNKLLTTRLDELRNEFANLDTVIFQIADLSDSVSNLTHQQKSINQDLTNQLTLLEEKRHTILQTRDKFIY